MNKVEEKCLQKFNFDSTSLHQMNPVRKKLTVQKSVRFSEDLEARFKALHMAIGGKESDLFRQVFERGILHFNFVEASLGRSPMETKNKKAPRRNLGANKERKNEDSHFA